MRELRHFGERRIIEELLRPRYADGANADFGDDCVVFPLNANDSLVLTIDPCPHPMAWLLGYKDYYYYGWLLATINLSDLAAMGAKPLGLLTSLMLPNNMTEKDFTRLLDGVDAAARQAGTTIMGGNIKEAREMVCEAVAVGKVRTSEMIRRVGTVAGDVVVAIGDLGNFWAGILAKREGLSLTANEAEHILRNVLTPRAKIAEGQAVAKHGLLSAGMDNSDGLYPSVKELATRNDVDVVLDLSGVEWDPIVMKVARLLSIDVARLALGWGDWQLIVTAPAKKIAEIRSRLGELDTTVNVIGHVQSGNGKVKMVHDGRVGEMMPLDSERFSAKSWFTHGIDGYIEELRYGDLIT